MMNEDRLIALLDFLEKDPSDEFTRFALALEYRKLGRTDEAVEQLELLRSRSPDYVGTYYHLGSMYREAGDAEQARAVLKMGARAADNQRDHHAKAEILSLLNELDDIDPFA